MQSSNSVPPAIPDLIYCWDPLGGALANPKTAQPVDTIFASTTYYLTVTDANGNCPQLDTVMYTQISPPVFSPVGGTVCEGGSLQIGADPRARTIVFVESGGIFG